MDTDPHRLDGRVAVVTGAGRGIGAAVARDLAALGATTVVVDRQVSPSKYLAASSRSGSPAACAARAIIALVGSRSATDVPRAPLAKSCTCLTMYAAGSPARDAF